MKKDVFISYSTKDRPLAESLVNFLEGHGFSCFISSRDIPLGATWTPYIIDALEEIKVMVILFKRISYCSFSPLKSIQFILLR